MLLAAMLHNKSSKMWFINMWIHFIPRRIKSIGILSLIPSRANLFACVRRSVCPFSPSLPSAGRSPRGGSAQGFFRWVSVVNEWKLQFSCAKTIFEEFCGLLTLLDLWKMNETPANVCIFSCVAWRWGVIGQRAMPSKCGQPFAKKTWHAPRRLWSMM